MFISRLRIIGRSDFRIGMEIVLSLPLYGDCVKVYRAIPELCPDFRRDRMTVFVLTLAFVRYSLDRQRKSHMFRAHARDFRPSLFFIAATRRQWNLLIIKKQVLHTFD